MLSRVGKYEVKPLLGKGATGSVYLAIDPLGQREVAIKVLETLSADPEDARRQLRFFQNEAALAGKLRHPHIVSILDAGLEDMSAGEPLRYLVMEVVDGPALTKYCDPAALLDPMKTAEIRYNCCKALEFANTLGVVHRDMKPAHILTRGIDSAELDIKVADFAEAAARLLGQQRSSQALSEAEKFSASRRLSFFKRFNDVGLWEAVRASRWQQHPAGALLIQEGTPDEHFFVLASGMLKVTQRGKLLNAVSAGECVGEMAYARRDGQPRSATVTAIEPRRAEGLRVQDIDALSESCRARFNEAFLSIMAARLAMLGGRLVAM